MPLIYGEGRQAFLRLQQEILRVSDDHSLFAWGAPKTFSDMNRFEMPQVIPQMHGLFADSAEDFMMDHEILEADGQNNNPPPVIHSGAVQLQYQVCTNKAGKFIILASTIRDAVTAHIGIPGLERWKGRDVDDKRTAVSRQRFIGAIRIPNLTSPK
ncbi:hypothetical protein F5Y19DRAFT_473213 [Xylariaceae sp. FL1651]|nr:hypothetical protein F5Y19DRAFT_473213 [Xylariaceae sp. FL1651]